MKNKRIRQICFILLCFGLMLSLSKTVHATGNDEELISQKNFASFVNPLYEDIIEESLPEDEISEDEISENEIQVYALPEYTTDTSKVVANIREALRERMTSFTIYYHGNELTEEMLYEWIDLALEETDNPKEGDYIRWHYQRINANWSSSSYDGIEWNHTIAFKATYHSNASQEAEVDVLVDEIMEAIGVSEDESDYNNLKLIYDYICENVEYDHENLNDDTYTLKYTAYAALVNKKAVCQGYASLLYYMGRKAGLDIRVIAGVANDENHGWNIVKLDDDYYYADSTWDAGKSEYKYFLKGSDNFTDHVSFDEYKEEAFTSKYPISKPDYVHDEKEELFADVYEDAWFYDAVMYVNNKGIMMGSDGKFNPDDEMNRAMMVTTLYRVEGSPTVTDYAASEEFSDIEEGWYYVDPVNWAYHTGVTTGYPEQKIFGVNDNVTREQVATFLFRYAKMKGYNMSASADIRDCVGANEVSWYAQDAMKWAVGAKLISGIDTWEDGVKISDLAPQGFATRAQLATILMRFCEYYGL